MKSTLIAMALGAGIAVCASAYAQAPAGATALCKDGSYYSNASKKGACSKHGGVKDWYGDNAPKSEPSATTPPDKNTAVLVPDKTVPSVARATPAAGAAPDRCGSTPVPRFITAKVTSGTARQKQANT